MAAVVSSAIILIAIYYLWKYRRKTVKGTDHMEHLKKDDLGDKTETVSDAESDHNLLNDSA